MIRYFITFLILLCFSCSSYKLALLNHDPMYPVDYVIPIADDTKIDTINSFSHLRYKLRTDFNFRWDFAQYAMNQPYSWYWNNPRLDGIWRPYNRFDVYFYSNWFWTDWAWNYPHYSFGWNHSYYSWYRPYRPWSWNNQWNSSYQNVAYINGRRGSRNIENTINRRYENPRPLSNNLNEVITQIRNSGIKPRVYSNPNNVNINNNSSRPVINNNVKPNYNNSSWSRPSINNVNNNSVNSNFSRGGTSSNISRGSSSSSGGSSRGGRINN